MELKLLQKDVGNILGVTEDSITNWEANRSTPQIKFFPHIIKFLGYLPFENDITTLSGKLKAYRYMNGLSHKQMGKILEVNASTIGAWEKGEQAPKPKILGKLELSLKMKDTPALSDFLTNGLAVPPLRTH